MDEAGGEQGAQREETAPTRQETRLLRRVQELCLSLEKLQLTEYMRYLNDRRRLLWVNFLSGLARGFGVAVGFSILGAIMLAILQRITVENMPLLGRFLADVVRLVQENLGKY